MIKINLGGDQKRFQLPTILGVELTTLNFKFIIIVFVIAQLPDYMIYPRWAEDQATIESKVRELEKNKQELLAATRGNESYLEKIQAYKKQVEVLKEREKYVEQIISKRVNPYKLLVHVARSTPEDLWINNLTIGSGYVNIRGFSRNYKSIGNFVSNLNQSIFFNDSIQVKSSQTIEEGPSKNRIESFELIGNIARYQ